MHPSRQELLGLVLGTLEDCQADALVTHLAHCPECENTIRGLENEADELLLDLRQPLTDDRFASEADCRQFVDAVKRFGGHRSSAAQPTPAAAAIDMADLGDLGQYQLLAKLGQGGMGAVFKAMHTRLRRPVALKVLPIERMQKTDALARFEREMQAVGQLSHPNVVAALDAGEADGVHYLVMELVEGIDLSKLWRRLGPLDMCDACELVRQAAVGLEYAHQRGMVHRDVKPSNLMLASANGDGALVKVLDLGLALWEDSTNSGFSDLTASGQTMGTFEYMAPEQCLDSHVVDPRADLYALGATLYTLLAGEGPFTTERYNTPLRLMMAKATTPAPSLATKRSDLPPALVATVDQLLAIKPGDRLASAAEVAAALAPFSVGADLDALLDATSVDAAAESLGQSGVGTNDDLGRGSCDTPPTVQLPSRSELVGAPVAQRRQVPVGPPNVAPGDSAIANLGDDPGVKRPLRSIFVWTAALGAAALALVVFLRPDPGTIVEIGKANLRAGSNRADKPPSDRLPQVEVNTSDAPARQAVLRVLEVGGRVEVKTQDSDPRWVERAESLPTVPLSIEWIEVHRDRAGPITVEWLREVLQGAPALQGIALHEQAVGDEAMSLLTQSNSLTHAMLSDVDITDAGLAALASLPLVQLNVGKNQIGDLGIRALGTPADLKLIVLTETQITDEALRHIAAWPQLQSLSLASTAITNRGLAHLEKLASLREIDLDGTQVTRAGVNRFRRALPGCRVTSEYDP